jgi:hypothetical protein
MTSSCSGHSSHDRCGDLRNQATRTLCRHRIEDLPCSTLLAFLSHWTAIFLVAEAAGLLGPSQASEPGRALGLAGRLQELAGRLGGWPEGCSVAAASRSHGAGGYPRWRDAPGAAPCQCKSSASLPPEGRGEAGADPRDRVLIGSVGVLRVDAKVTIAVKEPPARAPTHALTSAKMFAERSVSGSVVTPGSGRAGKSSKGRSLTAGRSA